MVKKCSRQALFPVYCLKRCGSLFSGHRSFVYSFILLSVLLHLHSLLPSLCPHRGCQLQANSSRWLSVVQSRPGLGLCVSVCVQLCNVPELGAANMRPTETATVSSKELSRHRCVRCSMLCVCVT